LSNEELGKLTGSYLEAKASYRELASKTGLAKFLQSLDPFGLAVEDVMRGAIEQYCRTEKAKGSNPPRMDWNDYQREMLRLRTRRFEIRLKLRELGLELKD
jgi:hypothetical protein